MKKLIFSLAFVFAFVTAKSADTTYINAPEVKMMLVQYIDEIYSYEVIRDISINLYEDPEAVEDINKWMETKEGHYHAMSQTPWNEKYKSFVKMFPQKRYSGNVSTLLKKMVMLNIKIFFYMSNASIVTIDGNFHGIIFFDDNKNEKDRWFPTVRDKEFYDLYRNGKDDDGISWSYKIHRAMAKQKKA